MTPDHLINSLYDILEGKKLETSVSRYLTRNVQAITSSVDLFAINGDSDYDNPVSKTMFRAFLVACYNHKQPTGHFNIVMDKELGRGLAQLISSYAEFVEGDPYLTTLDALLQRQRMAWSDKETDLPVESRFIIAYDGDFCLTEYASAKALEEFGRKINTHRQSLIVISEKPIDERGHISNGTNTVYFDKLGYGTIDVHDIIEEVLGG